MAKSTIVVVPPCAAATVPVSKSSAEVVPPKGMSRWVCASMPPGRTYLPAASITTSAAGTVSRSEAWVSATILSPSIQTSAPKVSDAVTTVPFLIRVRLDAVMFASLLHESIVGFGAAVAIELPRPPDLLDHLEVEVRGDELALVLAGRHEEIAARIDEVRGAVELADVPGGLRPDAVHRADVIADGHRVRRLLELPQVLRQARDRGARVEDDLGPVEAQDASPLGEVAVIADVDTHLRICRLEH